MSDLKKNEKYQTGCTGSLYFNPANLDRQVMSYQTYIDPEMRFEFSISAYASPAPSLGDIVAFGGQFVGYISNATGSASITTYEVAIPEETWPSMSSIGSSVLTTYLNNFDYVYTFRPNEDEMYIEGTTSYGTGYSKHPNTCITGVRIKEYSESPQRKTFGFHRKQFDVLTTYNAILEIPPSVDKIKIDQLLNSEAVIFVPDDKVISVKSLATGWNFDKPKGGGCVNPMGRKVSIKDGEMKFGLRRGFQYINCIFEG